VRSGRKPGKKGGIGRRGGRGFSVNLRDVVNKSRSRGSLQHDLKKKGRGTRGKKVGRGGGSSVEGRMGVLISL